MQPDTTINLGAFQFANFEIPERISWGGSQRIAIHELVGGQRVLDAMGRSDRALTWSGLFRGPNATDRARFLDTMRAQGANQKLTFGQLAYMVKVREFEPEYERFYQIPYRISLEVIADLANPVTALSPPSLDSDIATDYSAASSLAVPVGDSMLTSLLATVGTTIAAVRSFANASPSTLSSVRQPLAAVSSRIAILINLGGDLLARAPSFGGVQPGAPPGVAAASLAAQSANLSQLNGLLRLNSVVNRMSANLVAPAIAPKTVTTAGGNLFTISQQQYGDATDWTGIANANGISDPFIQGTQTLSIPAEPDGADGVLSA